MWESRNMRIAIVDDDVTWRKRVREEIVRYHQTSSIQIDEYVSGEQYLDSKKEYDISFIDIEMPGLDGFDTILKAKVEYPEGIFVILTTHVEMSRKGYVVNAFRYIDKTKLEEVAEALEAAQVVLGGNEKITVNVIGDRQRKVALKNIIYIETEKHYIVVHTRQDKIKCSDYLIDVEAQLPINRFCRCHNAYIVNLDEIDHMDERVVYLSNGEDIDVSFRKLRQFKKQYLNRQYECANK